jgi:proline iminopeptidase
MRRWPPYNSVVTDMNGLPMDVQAPHTDLFPEISPYAHGMLKVDGRHTLYWELSGNPKGKAVVFLHGGPGAGTLPVHRRFFDPDHYRIVVFDQRGAGRSTPAADISDNTTAHLIEDMETLRRHLGIERWLVFGGSWGACLAIAYGIAYPERCAGFVLRGVFLGRQRELDWFLHGMGTIFPEARRAFTDFLPADERGDVANAYHQRLTSPDAAIHRPAAQAWGRYENACSVLVPKFNGGGASLALARIESHYFKNAMFMAENHLLDNLDRIRHLPAAIVQGRYDVVCPIVTADELARAWPDAEMTVVPDAGHAAMETGIRTALVTATERFKG